MIQIQPIQPSRARYSKQALTQGWLQAEKQLGRIPKVKEFESVGLPHIGYYNRAWGSYTNFLNSVGKNMPATTYKTKTNPKRYFRPDEWIKFINVINNPKHKFWFEFLLHTGMRYDEACNVKVKHIELNICHINILKPKGGRTEIREIMISEYLRDRINHQIRVMKLSEDDFIMTNKTKNGRWKTPSIAYMDKALKTYCKKTGIKDYEDFSCHTFRKTLEMYGIALNVHARNLEMHFGHTPTTANKHYISPQLFTQEEKVLIKSILDTLWN